MNTSSHPKAEWEGKFLGGHGGCRPVPVDQSGNSTDLGKDLLACLTPLGHEDSTADH